MACFNEAATFRPRNRGEQGETEQQYTGFNEAATFRPRNRGGGSASRIADSRFNEAATFRPRNHHMIFVTDHEVAELQ